MVIGRLRMSAHLNSRVPTPLCAGISGDQGNRMDRACRKAKGGGKRTVCFS